MLIVVAKSGNLRPVETSRQNKIGEPHRKNFRINLRRRAHVLQRRCANARRRIQRVRNCRTLVHKSGQRFAIDVRRQIEPIGGGPL